MAQFDSNLFIQQDEEILRNQERYYGYIPNLDVVEERMSIPGQYIAKNILENRYIENNSHLFPGSMDGMVEEDDNMMDLDPNIDSYPADVISSINYEIENNNMVEDEISSFLDTVFDKDAEVTDEHPSLISSSSTDDTNTSDNISVTRSDISSDETTLQTYNNAYHQVQKSSYLQVLEPRCPTGHELYQNPSTLVNVNTLMNYPTESAKAFNMGNIERIRHLMSSYFNDNCLMRVIKPTFTEERVGTSYIALLLNALLESFPDAVNIIKSVKYCRSKTGARLLKVKYTFSGTQITSTPLQEFKPSQGKEESILADMDTSTLSAEEVETYHRRELALKAQGKLINIESDIVLKMYIDNFTNKVGIYEATCKASSFRAVE